MIKSYDEIEAGAIIQAQKSKNYYFVIECHGGYLIKREYWRKEDKSIVSYCDVVESMKHHIINLRNEYLGETK